MAAQLTTYDEDNNAQLSLQEYELLWLDRFRAQIVDTFQTIDVDGDGLIGAEGGVFDDEQWAAFDLDIDGYLSLVEYEALWLDQYLENMVDAFQAVDADGDRNITVAEFHVGHANIVELLDLDGDGAIGQGDRANRP